MSIFTDMAIIWCSSILCGDPDFYLVNFPSLWRASFNLLCMEIYGDNFLAFIYFIKSIVHFYFERIVIGFIKSRILFSYYLIKLFHYHTTCIVSQKEYAIKFILFLLCVMYHVSLATFKQCICGVSWCIIFFKFLVFGILLRHESINFDQIWKKSAIISSIFCYSSKHLGNQLHVYSII